TIADVSVAAGDHVEIGTVLARYDHVAGTSDEDIAVATLDQRLILATQKGTIGNVHVQSGHRVDRGEPIAVIYPDHEAFEVYALLPGEDRPQLSPGMAMRLELRGYRQSYQSVLVDSVAPDVVAPAEARRILGADVADGLRLNGPVVVVRA